MSGTEYDALVIGGGNIWRGLTASHKGMTHHHCLTWVSNFLDAVVSSFF
jgi:hypothetical protein